MYIQKTISKTEKVGPCCGTLEYMLRRAASERLVISTFRELTVLLHTNVFIPIYY